MGLRERLAAFVTNPPAPSNLFGDKPSMIKAPANAPAIEEKAALTRAPYASAIRFQIAAPNQMSRRSTKLLRHFADSSPPLRTAINWRKQQVSQSRWRIVRTDDPKKPPSPKVVKQATQLFKFINPARKSLRSLLDQIVEDLLVLDAGTIEKEKTVGGQLLALWPVDGSTIAPDPMWDQAKNRGGSECDPNAIRYRQVIDGRVEAELRNDQLVYIMQNETTHRVLGWSPVETLVSIIEAELYGERYDFDMMRNAAPAGLLYLGSGISDQQNEAFRAYYESEIAGTKDIAFWGGGEAGSKPEMIKFGFSPAEMQREQYKTWLINKIAFVFQIDKTIFGLVDDVNRSTSRTMSARTDQGFVALARLVSEYFTREIMWEIDENHGFEFTDLMVIDEMAQAKIDQIRMQIGATYPNEIRARDGLDEVEWGDEPYNAAGSPTPDPLDPDAEPKPEGDAAEDDETEPKPGDDDAAGTSGGSKGAVPFAARANRTRRTRSAKSGYLGS